MKCLNTYDNAGNITSKKTYALTAANVTPSNATSTVNYGYSDSTWGDLLTSYGSSAITYDGIGNPTSYRGITFAWTGRNLTYADNGYYEIEMQYNADGLRIGKYTTEYTYYHQYYYEGDLGLYYLQTRYYDPATFFNLIGGYFAK